MITKKDLFLLLASLDELKPNKAFVKRLSATPDDFLKLFTSDSVDSRLEITKEEINKIKILQDELKKLNLGSIKKALEATGTSFLALYEENYPVKLKSIVDPPIGLFYKGDISTLNKSKCVAIVGTRSATNYGLSISKKIASLLAKRGITVISGLASGIDASAHIGALEHGKTIAVLGTGVDIIFPLENKELFLEILAKGNLVLSEYPPRTGGLPWNFPQRNRIISALSDAVVIMEGDINSGALITARFAIKYGKPLFALPGPLESPTSNGPNILIKSKVAELLTSVEDILEKIEGTKQTQLNLRADDKEIDSLSENQKDIYKLLSFQSKSFDSLQGGTNLHTQELIKHLSILELKGLIEKTIDGGYVKC